MDKVFCIFSLDEEYGYFTQFRAVFSSEEKIIEEITKEMLKENRSAFADGSRIEIVKLQSFKGLAVFDDYVVHIWQNKRIEQLFKVLPYTLNEFGVLE